MKANVGTIDRILRATLGIVLLLLALTSNQPFFSEPVMLYGAILVGVVMLATSSLKLCPLYSIFGLKTCKTC